MNKKAVWIVKNAAWAILDLHTSNGVLPENMRIGEWRSSEEIKKLVSGHFKMSLLYNWG